MGRLFLAVWLAVFAFQVADLGAILSPDDCVLSVSENSSNDPCPDGCVRCVCCARTSIPASPVIAVGPADTEVTLKPLTPADPFSNAHPLGIFHVPKSL